MPQKIKHITLVCTDTAEMMRLHSLLRDSHPQVNITFAGSVAELLAGRCDRLPDMLVILPGNMPGDTPAGNHCLAAIRKNPCFDGIPVVAWPAFPGRGDLASLLAALQGSQPCFQSKQPHRSEQSP